jgi:hypothetical protein
LYYANAGIRLITFQSPGTLTREATMNKLILGGTFVILGVIQLADWVQEKPVVGTFILVAVIASWAFELIKDMRGSRR